MAIVKKIAVDNMSGSAELRDIGADAQNVSFSEQESVKDKLDQHDDHIESSVVSENGVHGLRIYDDVLQSYNEAEEEWTSVSTGNDVPEGGSANQGLIKASAADNDTVWADVLLKNGSVAADSITAGSRKQDATTGLESLATGSNNAAAGRGAQAQGTSNNASGNYSHAEGQSSSASGIAAHAEGSYTVATGNASHAEGDHTEAGYTGQHVTGKYNDNKEDTLFEVGNGTLDNERSNAFEVTSDGYIRTHGNNVKIAFGVDSNGRYGYIKEGADTVTPFKGNITLQDKTVSPTTEAQTVTADLNYDGLGEVTVNAIKTQTKSTTPTTSAQTITPDNGKYLTEVSVGAIQTQTKTVSPSTSSQTVTPDEGKYLTSVGVNAISTQTKSVSPTTSTQTVTPDTGKYLTSVSIGAISTQSKSATLSGSQQVITPDSGKYLTSVTVPGVIGNAIRGHVLTGETFSTQDFPTGMTGTFSPMLGTTYGGNLIEMTMQVGATIDYGVYAWGMSDPSLPYTVSYYAYPLLYTDCYLTAEFSTEHEVHLIGIKSNGNTCVLNDSWVNPSGYGYYSLNYNSASISGFYTDAFFYIKQFTYGVDATISKNTYILTFCINKVSLLSNQMNIKIQTTIAGLGRETPGGSTKLPAYVIT